MLNRSVRLGVLAFGVAVAGCWFLVAMTGNAMAASREELVRNAPVEDHLETQDGLVRIFAIHHASLMLEVKGKHIFIDPAPLEEKGNAIADFKAMKHPDVILYTHSHYDHFNAGILEAMVGPETRIIAPQETAGQVPAHLRDRVLVMAAGGTATAFGVGIEAVAMYNTTPERSKFHPKGLGNGYVLTIGGKRIYIAGDTEEAPEIAHIHDIDVAFVPVNLPYTMAVPAAAQWVKSFKPKVVYPYHFRNGDGSLSNLEAFTTDVGPASLVKLLRWY